MFAKISSIPLTAYVAIKGLAYDIKNDIRGLSGVVVAVLLILVAVLAILVIWLALSGWLEDLWERIVSDADAGLQ